MSYERRPDTAMWAGRLQRPIPLQFYPLPFNEFSRAPALLSGLRHISRANRVFSNNQHIWLQFTRDYVYCCHYDEDRGPGYDQRTAFRTGIGLQVIRTFLGPDWCPKLILTETPLDALPDRERLAGAKIVRSRGFGAVQVARTDLAVGSRHLVQHGYDAGSARSASLPEQVRSVLRSLPTDSLPTSRALAEMLNLSERTLQRRLRERGTRFSALLQATKFESARRLLADHDNRIVDIAFELGFDDQSHFTRYFRNFCGVTPREYRKLAAEPAPAV